jgi:hypothetical protein
MRDPFDDNGNFGCVVVLVWLIAAALAGGFWGVVVWAIIKLTNHYT